MQRRWQPEAAEPFQATSSAEQSSAQRRFASDSDGTESPRESVEVPTKKVRALIGIFLLVCRRRKCASTWSRNIWRSKVNWWKSEVSWPSRSASGRSRVTPSSGWRRNCRCSAPNASESSESPVENRSWILEGSPKIRFDLQAGEGGIGSQTDSDVDAAARLRPPPRNTRPGKSVVKRREDGSNLV